VFGIHWPDSLAVHQQPATSNKQPAFPARPGWELEIKKANGNDNGYGNAKKNVTGLPLGPKGRLIHSPGRKPREKGAKSKTEPRRGDSKHR